MTKTYEGKIINTVERYNGWTNWATWSFSLWLDACSVTETREIDEVYKEAYSILKRGGEFGDFERLGQLHAVNLEEIKRNREVEL